MNSTDPEQFSKPVGEIWTEQARLELKVQIIQSLELIRGGYFSGEELAFVDATDSVLDVPFIDDELSEILESGDVEAWNRYSAEHPEMDQEINDENRRERASLALRDFRDVAAYSDLEELTAIDQVILDRRQELEERAGYMQKSLEIAAKHGFAV